MDHDEPRDEPPCLNGQAALDSRWAFEQVLGGEKVAEAVAVMPDALREQYLAVRPLDWVPYPVMTAFHDAVGEVTGISAEQLFEEVIPRAMRRSFSTVWRVLIRLTTDRALIARTPLLYKRTRTRGTMHSNMLGKRHAEVWLTGWPEIPDRDLIALRISIESLVRIAGRTEVEARAARTEDGARWEVTWQG